MSICASDWTAPLVPSPVADLLADLAAALRLGCAYRVTTGTSTRDG